MILVVGIGLNLGGGGNEEGADFASSETVAATTAATERSADEAASMLQSTEAPAETAETAVAAAEAAVAEEEAIATDATGGRAGAGLIATPDEFRFHPVGDIQQNPDQLIDAMLRYEQDAYVGVLPIEVIPVWAERVAARCWGEALAAVPDATALRLAGFGQWGTEGAEFYEFAGATDFVVVAAIRDTCEIVAVEIP